MKALWNPLPSVIKTAPFTLGDGLNNGIPPFDIKESECIDCLNIDSRAYPAMKVRDGREDVYNSTATEPYMLSHRNKENLMIVDDGVWKQYEGSSWVNIQTGLAALRAKTEDFATGTSLYTILSNGTNRYYYNGSTSSVLSAMPQTRYFTVHRGRVYALKDKQLKYCALNLITDWTTADDAGSITVTNMLGREKGVATYADHVIMFSESSMHELHGTGPRNFQLIDISLDIGCMSDLSIKEVRGRLYWLGYKHVYQYSGGTVPIPVSMKIQGIMDRINYQEESPAGTDGRRYYCSVCLDGSNEPSKLIVFDTETGNWYVEDSDIVDFVEFDNALYGIRTNGKIVNMASGTSDDGAAISWYAVSKPFVDGTIGEKKYWHELHMIVDLPTGSTLNVGLSTDVEGDTFATIKSLTAGTSIKNERLIVPLNIAQNADWVRIKLFGTGPCTVHKLERKTRIARRG